MSEILNQLNGLYNRKLNINELLKLLNPNKKIFDLLVANS